MSKPKGGVSGSLFELGESIVQETARLPKDIGQAALESLGTHSGNKQDPQTPRQDSSGKSPEGQDSGWIAIDSVKEKQSRRALARAALESLAPHPAKSRLSVWEEKVREEEAKKEEKKHTEKEIRASILPQTGSKRPKGDLYGISAKAGSEKGKNVRSD